MNKQETAKNVLGKRKRSFFASQTIKQLMSPNPLVPYCWAAQRFVSLPSEDYPGEQGGLLFMVDARKFTGKILITLDWMDTYNIDFYTKEGDVVTEVVEMALTNIYADQLQNVIDLAVETDKDHAG